MAKREEVYDPDTDRYYPKIDVTAHYEIRNRKNSLVTIMLQNEGGTEMHSLTLTARETYVVDGSRMTKYVFESQRVGDVLVKML